MNEEYLSIKEFAEAAGVSRQYIYRIKDTVLKPYARKIEKVFVLHRDGLAVINGSTDSTLVEQLDSTSNNADSEPVVEKVESTNSTNDSTMVEMLQMMVSELQKDKESLRQQLAVKDLQIQNLNDRLAAAMDMNKGQLLLAAEKEQKKDPIVAADPVEETKTQEEKEPENEVVSDVAEEPIEADHGEDQTEIQSQEAEPAVRTEESVKVRWWRRLFRKDPIK